MQGQALRAPSGTRGSVVGRRSMRVTCVAAPPTPARTPASTGSVSGLKGRLHAEAARGRAPLASFEMDRAQDEAAAEPLRFWLASRCRRRRCRCHLPPLESGFSSKLGPAPRLRRSWPTLDVLFAA